MKIVDYFDSNLVWFLRKADEVMILSSATNALTMLFKAAVAGAEKCLLPKDFFIHSKTIIWIKGKTWNECKTLLLPYYGNMKARTNRRHFDLQTCINNPLCLNLEQFACYHDDAEFLISLLKTDAFAQSEYLDKIECLRFEKEELVPTWKKILTTDPTMIDHPFLKPKWRSVAKTLLQQIHDPNLNDPLKDNVELTAKLMQKMPGIRFKQIEENLNNRDDDFLKSVFQQIEKNVWGEVWRCTKYFGEYIKRSPERTALLSDKIKWPFIFDLCSSEKKNLGILANQFSAEAIGQFIESQKVNYREDRTIWFFEKCIKYLPLESFFQAVDNLIEKDKDSHCFTIFLAKLRGKLDLSLKDEVLLDLVEIRPEMFRFLDEKKRNNMDFVKKCLSNSDEVFRYVGHLKPKKIIPLIVKILKNTTNPLSLVRFLPENWRKDEVFILDLLKAFKQTEKEAWGIGHRDFQSLWDVIDPSLKKNEEFVISFAKEFFPQDNELYKNKEVIKKAVEVNHRIFSLPFESFCGPVSENYNKYIEFIDELHIINPKVLENGFAYINERTDLDVKVLLTHFVTKNPENFKYFWCNDSNKYKDCLEEMKTINEKVLFYVHDWKKDILKDPNLVSTIVDKPIFTKNLETFVDNGDSKIKKIKKCFFPILIFNRRLSLKSNVKLAPNTLQLIFSYHYLNSLSSQK